MVTHAAPVTLTAVTALVVTGLTPAPAPAADRAGRPPMTVDALPPVVYTAHRGGALEVPENSMSGLVAAYERGTAQVLDVDTRMLRDGTLVAMHDATLDRTTDGTGPVRALSAKEWKQVRIRPDSALRTTWRPERPPTIAEVLDRFGGRVVLMLEAKDADSLKSLARLVHSRGLSRSVFVNSNKPSVAERAHRLGLVSQLWRSAKQMRTDRFERFTPYVDVLDVDYRARDEDLRRAVGSGIPRVWAHTVNTPYQRDRVLRLGCNGVITDAPGLLSRTPVKGLVRAQPPTEG
ncbi:glycerophosphodiester phosphodiesterase family protein [Streptomyces sp. TRM66268-LWL]|uniref:Glycerophosphodiester phosphodiesterase family protein n=1 Tax=Streptomyces polyasparticus TaxID=2767826 RepID=A0ABR7SC40_9ACTN|nr:glycerophosphodiester phosphodiesterase family protein [Streptomyces polyasparticus]MBC9712449.1 glycerophosphodiester phosphodiesterase family protein [Streptomyces polyasparticus]